MDRQARVDLEDAVESAVLCWLATINDDGGPSVSPKEIFTLCGPQSLAIADIASSNSVWNIRARPRVCVSLIDVFRQRGAQLYGDARIAGRGDAARLSGVIDFYFACVDLFAYDLAICINAWCFELDGSFNATKAMRLTARYSDVRPLSGDERAALPLLCRGAALRFALTPPRRTS